MVCQAALRGGFFLYEVLPGNPKCSDCSNAGAPRSGHERAASIHLITTTSISDGSVGMDIFNFVTVLCDWLRSADRSILEHNHCQTFNASDARHISSFN